MRKVRKESTTSFVKGLVCRWDVQKMRSEVSEYVFGKQRVSLPTVGEST